MVSATQVHRLLRDALDGTLRDLGYRRPRGRQTFWYRSYGRGYVLLWIQLDKYGYSPSLGGKLWLNCQSGTRVAKTLGDEILPPSEVCSRSQLKQWQSAKRSVLTKVLRKPDLGIDELFREFVADDLQEPYRRGSLAEMPYLERKDVERWADLLCAILPALDEEMTRRLTHRTTQVTRAARVANPRRPRRRQ